MGLHGVQSPHPPRPQILKIVLNVKEDIEKKEKTMKVRDRGGGGGTY